MIINRYCWWRWLHITRNVFFCSRKLTNFERIQVIIIFLYEIHMDWIYTSLWWFCLRYRLSRCIWWLSNLTFSLNHRFFIHYDCLLSLLTPIGLIFAKMKFGIWYWFSCNNNNSSTLGSIDVVICRWLQLLELHIYKHSWLSVWGNNESKHAFLIRLIRYE
jgi:hypothetical protein